MSSATATEPLDLGKWQQPAALIQAGLAPPDPYPLEKILFCATCDQKFFGTVADSTRFYRSQCGCRLRPLPADQVESLTYAETRRLTFGTDTTTDLSSAHLALLTLRIFSRITLGTTVDDINFTARI